MKHMILAAVVALALTGPAGALSKLSSEKCAKFYSLSLFEAERTLVLQSTLISRRLQRAKEIAERDELYSDPITERIIRENEENLRLARAAAVEYNTIWRNLCKD